MATNEGGYTTQTTDPEPGFAERNPLVIRGAVVAAIVAVLELLVILGVISLTEDQTASASLVVGVIATAVVVIWSRGAVTPTVDPRNDEGERLVPESRIPVTSPIPPSLDPDTLD